MRIQSIAVVLAAFFAVSLFSSCIDDDAGFQLDCPTFNSQYLEYFPQEVGDVIRFQGVDSTEVLDRRFQVTDSRSFSDTTITSLFEDATCDPFTEFLLIEQDTNVTFFNYVITDLASSSPGDFVLFASIVDVSYGGNEYNRQVLVRDGTPVGDANTDAALIDSLTLDGTLYTDVIRMDVINAPEFASANFNDVRSIWVAPGFGIIRFRDEQRGAFNRIP